MSYRNFDGKSDSNDLAPLKGIKKAVVFTGAAALIAFSARNIYLSNESVQTTLASTFGSKSFAVDFAETAFGVFILAAIGTVIKDSGIAKNAFSKARRTFTTLISSQQPKQTQERRF